MIGIVTFCVCECTYHTIVLQASSIIISTDLLISIFLKTEIVIAIGLRYSAIIVHLTIILVAIDCKSILFYSHFAFYDKNEKIVPMTSQDVRLH